ncbi:MAG: mechanosensitive ion channel family protein [Pseudomonadales bacterium]|nr:mechanosensitive ion channel family protein [Pseudomonadales bacterium]
MEFEQLLSPGVSLGGNILRAVILLLAGWVTARLLSSLSKRLSDTLISSHHKILLAKAVFWGVLILFLISSLHQLGFKLGVLLGTAGIVSVALGFAAQTSASNLISGLFVLSEESFKIGDTISVAGTTGEVLSIDLLSVKLRTYDNIFIRIPNETIIKSEVRNISRFPIRRYDLVVGIAYRSDINLAREVLLQVASRNPLCLDNPEPLVIMQGFNTSSIDIQFAIWAAQENFLALRNSMFEEVKTAFDAAGIEIPYPHMTFYTGADCAPLPLQIVSGNSGDSVQDS